jgi:hypothetical protein
MGSYQELKICHEHPYAFNVINGTLLHLTGKCIVGTRGAMQGVIFENINLYSRVSRRRDYICMQMTLDLQND